MDLILQYISSDKALMWTVIVMACAYAATWIATVTPTNTDNKLLKPMLSVLNFIAGNVGSASNNADLKAQRDELKLKLAEAEKKLK